MNEYRHNSSEAIQRTQPGWFHPRRYYLKMLRKLIEYAIEKHIKSNNGILVDYGCGSMPYKTLLKYIDTMLKLSNEGVETDKVLDNQVREWEGNKLHFLAQESNMYLAYYHLLRQTQHIRWSGNKQVYYSNIAMIKRYLDKLIKLSNPQVLVEVKPTNNLTT